MHWFSPTLSMALLFPFIILPDFNGKKDVKKVALYLITFYLIWFGIKPLLAVFGMYLVCAVPFLIFLIALRKPPKKHLPLKAIATKAK